VDTVAAMAVAVDTSVEAVVVTLVVVVVTLVVDKLQEHNMPLFSEIQI
jgi:hypothetical protein